MASNNMTFYIRLENGQYTKASNQVIQQTEKMESRSRKNYKGMGLHADDFWNKMRRAFSWGALLAIAYRAISGFFSSVSKGMQRIVDNNQELKKTFSEIAANGESIFANLGKSILVNLTPALELINNLLKGLNDLIKTNNKERVGQLTAAKNILTSKNPTPQMIKEYKQNYGPRELDPTKGGPLLSPYLSVFEDKLNITYEKRAELLKKIRTEQGILNTSTDDQDKRKKKQEALTKATDEYYNALQNVSSKILDMADVNDENLLNIKKTADQWLGIADAVYKAAKSAQALKAAEDDMGNKAKEVKTDFSNIISIIGSILNIIIAIAGAIMDASKNNSVVVSLDEQINRLLKYRTDLLDQIESRMEVIAALQEKQSLYGNKTTNDLNAALKLKQDELKLQKEKYETQQKEVDELEKAKEWARNNIEYLKNENKIWEQLNTILPTPNYSENLQRIAGSEEYIKAIEAERIKIIGDMTKSETEQAKALKEISDIEYQISTITNTNLINQLDLEEKIIEARAERTGNYANEIDMINQQIDAYQAIIDATKKAIETSDSESQILDYQTSILENQLNIEEKRNQAEKLRGDQLQRQVDIMKKYVDLGLDLENIRVVKQLTKSFAAQGASGAELGAQLQGVGVQNRNIAGKTLNIFGDINNTLNQASPNVLINNMNDMINRIGGV
jgi:hypothetical protein